MKVTMVIKREKQENRELALLNLVYEYSVARKSREMKKFAVFCLIALFLTLGLPITVVAQEVDNVKAAIVCIPGLTQHSKTYNKLAESLAPHGIVTHAIDVKGFATSIVDGKQEQIDFHKTMESVKDWSVNFKKEHQSVPVFVLGESTGGTFAMMVAADYPEYIDGIICSAPTWKVTGMKKIAFYELLDLTLLRSKRRGLAVGKVFNLATSDKRARESLAQLESRRQRFTVVESMKFLMFTKKLPFTAYQIAHRPVLFVQGMKDKLSEPSDTAELFNSITSKRKTFILDNDAEHLIYEEGLFTPQLLSSLKDWILNTAEGQAPLTPKGILLSKEPVQGKKFESVAKVFAAAGVNANDTIAQDLTD